MNDKPGEHWYLCPFHKQICVRGCGERYDYCTLEEAEFGILTPPLIFSERHQRVIFEEMPTKPIRDQRDYDLNSVFPEVFKHPE